ncbi:MAG TPA: hypothetical protein VG122_21345 [Gemmata sp.]|nr:hypothetical protein [Gemmata sp.]
MLRNSVEFRRKSGDFRYDSWAMSDLLGLGTTRAILSVIPGPK